MKKVIPLIILLFLLGGLSYFGYKAIQKQASNKQTEITIKTLPFFSFYNLSKEKFTYKNKQQQPTLIIYFHPECEHCQYEAKQLFLNKEKFNGVKIIMISSASLENIQKFNTEYQLKDIEHLTVLWDKDQKFDSYFGSSTYPTLLIYNAENKLQKKYKGEVKMEAILKYLHK